MEWRIIFAVLCLIGHAASQAATSASGQYNISFSINDEFKTAYRNMSDPETLTLISNITTQLDPVFKKLPGYQNITIQSFSNGSIVTNAALQFNNSVNGPNATDVTQVLLNAITSRNVTLNITNNSINVTAPATVPVSVNAVTVSVSTITASVSTSASSNITATSANVTATSANVTATSANVTATSANVTATSANATATSANGTAQMKEYNISFSINDEFKTAYSNMSDPETLTLINNITTQLDPVFKKLRGYLRMLIRKFSNGSIVTDATLQFNNSPNATDVKQVLLDAIASGNLTLKIRNDSINVTVPVTASSNTTNTTTTPTATGTTGFNLTFNIIDTFNDSLSNMSSPASTSLKTTIADQFLKIFKRKFWNFFRMHIRKFSQGSIVTDSELQFFNNGTIPTARNLVDTIIDGIKSGNFTFKIDQKTIKVTDSLGNTVNSGSPVSSMLTALWMTLAFLLFTGVMHF